MKFQPFRFIFFLFILCVLGFSGSQARAAAEGRVALIIGNSNYPFAPLANPVNDARLIAQTLRGLGFEVLDHYDITQKKMKRAINHFGDRLEALGRNSVGLFYYAGHGVQVRGRNYMIPVDAQIERERDVDIEALSAEAVLGTMAFAQNRLNFIIMDACRNNPFSRQFRSVSRGLARMDAPRGSMIAYATAPGEVAADGKGKNSPYTLALAKSMKQPGLTAEAMFKRVRIDVMRETNQRQVPWEASSLTGDFYFKGQPPKPVEAAKPTGPTAEMVFWQSIQNSDDPETFKAYIRRFPGGDFISLARVNIRHLERLQKQQQGEQSRIALLEQERLSLEKERLRLARAAQQAKQIPAPSTAPAGPNPETVFWQTIQNSSDADMFQTYLQKYPKGEFALLANANIKRLLKKRKKEKTKPLSKKVVYPAGARNFDGKWKWVIKYSLGKPACRDRTSTIIIKNSRIRSKIVFADWGVPLGGKIDKTGRATFKGVDEDEHFEVVGRFSGNSGEGKIRVTGGFTCKGTWVATWYSAE